jgi:tetratricopeptide (TPR) repeat protein
MNNNKQLLVRHVLPRWNSVKKHLKSNEVLPQGINDTTFSNFSEYEQAVIQWEKERNFLNAIEVLSQSRLSQLPDNSEVLGFLLKVIRDNDNIPNLIKGFLSEDFTAPIMPASPSQSIAIDRKLVALQPLNALIWVELARDHLIVGNLVKSEKALKIANQLEPNNRYILRATARYYQHITEYGLALDILRRSELINVDPWIISSDLAIASCANRPLSKFNRARDMIFKRDIDPRAITELAGEVGTIEGLNGSIKTSKKAFLYSMQELNENSFAQIAWANDNLIKLDTSMLGQRAIEDPFEANVYLGISENKDWDLIMQDIIAWHKYQPFSTIPISIGTIVYDDILCNYDAAIALCKEGLSANACDFELHNNLAYSHILNNEKDKANFQICEYIRKFSDLGQEVYFQAIQGMFEMRFGDIEKGKSFYQTACDIVKINRLNISVEMYYLRERKRIGEDVANEARALRQKIEIQGNKLNIAILDAFNLI